MQPETVIIQHTQNPEPIVVKYIIELIRETRTKEVQQYVHNHVQLKVGNIIDQHNQGQVLRIVDLQQVPEVHIRGQVRLQEAVQVIGVRLRVREVLQVIEVRGRVLQVEATAVGVPAGVAVGVVVVADVKS